MKDITVIIPVHKIDEGELDLLKLAIKSVEDQQVKPEELMIVGPKKIKKEINSLDFGDLNYKFVENSGETDFATQMNVAAESCDTQYFCLLELDDELSKIWLKNVKDYTKHYEDVNVFLPLITNVDKNNTFIGWTNEPVWAMNFSEEIGYLNLDALLNYPNFNIDGMVINTDFFLEIGGFKKNIKLTFIYEFLLRAVFMDARMMTIPKIGYKHLNMREGGLFYNYKNHPDFIIPSDQGAFWLETAKKEYFFTEDRNIEVKEL